jgi:hypothetical protein
MFRYLGQNVTTFNCARFYQRNRKSTNGTIVNIYQSCQDIYAMLDESILLYLLLTMRKEKPDT